VRFRLVVSSGEVLDEGEGAVRMAGGALVVSSTVAEVLRVRPADIVEISEPEPYAVRLALADGSVLDLLRLGAMRTQVLAELADARATGVTATLLLDGVGQPATFTGTVDGTDAELRLYDDALVVLPARGDAEKVPYPFVRDVTTSGYHIHVEVAGRPALELFRLARRTTEFVDLLQARCRATAGRTSAFLGVLLPGLGAIALRSVADLLRDGLAASRADLDRIDATVWPALAAAAARPDRVACLRVLEALGPVWIGFKQLVSVQRAAQGGQPWRDSSITPDLGGHGAGASSFGPGFGGLLAAGMVAGGAPRDLGFGGPFQTMGSLLAVSMLGTGGFGMSGAGFPGSGFGGQHQIRPRADVSRGRLTPEQTDVEALTAGGEEPTVLAFALCQAPGGALVYEVLNAADHPTCIYRAADAAALAALNRALDLVGFRVAGVYADAESAGSPYRTAARRLPALRVLREAFAGRVAHDDGWSDRLRAVLFG
jgi:hypothetical protein